MSQSALMLTCFGDHTVGRCVGMVLNTIAVANENVGRLQHTANAQAEDAIKSRLTILHSPGKVKIFLLLDIVTCARAEATLHGTKLFHVAYSVFNTLFFSFIMYSC